ncbi:hypothetical protein BS78_06G046600 [Paspalum vaginatum]|nr:hypothetical protein BS78_06G046600 [Paspalum vaginatum]
MLPANHRKARLQMILLPARTPLQALIWNNRMKRGRHQGSDFAATTRCPAQQDHLQSTVVRFIYYV